MSQGEHIIEDALLRGASFSLTATRQPERYACEFQERDQREATQRCNQEGARYILNMTFPQGGGALSRHICTNHAAKAAGHIGLAFPLETEIKPRSQ